MVRLHRTTAGIAAIAITALLGTALLPNASTQIEAADAEARHALNDEAAAIGPVDPLAQLADASELTITLCKDLAPRHDASDSAIGADADAVDITCPPALRPGAASNSCTLNFIVTDGERHYIGGAGHCAGLGKRLRVSGIPGEVGTAVHRVCCGPAGDWVFFEIDAEDEQFIDPTMCRFGGPIKGALGAHRIVVPGEEILQYGHGRGLGSNVETKGRIGHAATPLPVLGPVFGYTGSVGFGDSGSPVRATTGEAIGIAVAVATVTSVLFEMPGLVIASNFDDALSSLEDHLGREVWVVEGDPAPSWVTSTVDEVAS